MIMTKTLKTQLMVLTFPLLRLAFPDSDVLLAYLGST